MPQPSQTCPPCSWTRPAAPGWPPSHHTAKVCPAQALGPGDEGLESPGTNPQAMQSSGCGRGS